MQHVRRAAVQVLNVGAHNKASLIQGLLPTLMPLLYQQTVQRCDSQLPHQDARVRVHHRKAGTQAILRAVSGNWGQSAGRTWCGWWTWARSSTRWTTDWSCARARSSAWTRCSTPPSIAWTPPSSSSTCRCSTPRAHSCVVAARGFYRARGCAGVLLYSTAIAMDYTLHRAGLSQQVANSSLLCRACSRCSNWRSQGFAVRPRRLTLQCIPKGSHSRQRSRFSCVPSISLVFSLPTNQAGTHRDGVPSVVTSHGDRRARATTTTSSCRAT